ncbi:MAG: hypothetical protein EOO71_04315 [Myxococcaceae bacterium]|nr:MAG: hypothetical protein EOO71_04315 [Myxococcaceae bacterium]
MKAIPLFAAIATIFFASNAQAAAQKVCTIVAPTYNNSPYYLSFTLPAPPNWSVWTCAMRAQQMAVESGIQDWNQVRYRVECLHDVGDPNYASSRSPFVGSGTTVTPPAPNCGWY